MYKRNIERIYKEYKRTYTVAGNTKGIYTEYMKYIRNVTGIHTEYKWGLYNIEKQ